MTSDSTRKAANDTVAGARAAVEDHVDAASEAVTSAGEKVKAKLSDAAGGLPASASDTLARSQARVRRGVIRQPVEALLLAGAIGYLCGWATNRS